MPNINTALVSLWSKAARTEPSYILIMIFCALMFAIFSQRLFGIKSQYYILLATGLILFLMIFVMTSIFASDPKLIDNYFFDSINDIFDNAGSRNFLSVVTLILFIMLVYELVEYDNNDPQYFLDKITFGKNNYISNRTSGLIVMLGFSAIVSYTIMRTTRE
jgi:hypothetical protein